MSRTLPAFFAEEYARFSAFALRHWAVDAAFVRDTHPLLKPIHRDYLSLACAASVASHRGHRNEYAKGVAEAGHLCLILALRGLQNPSCVLLRQTIELTLKHIYFQSHPVEYSWARSRVDYKDLTFQALLTYITRTDEYRSPGDNNVTCEQIDYWYGLLSRHVHVHSRHFLGYPTIGKAYRPSLEDIKHLRQTTHHVWPRLTLLLASFHKAKFARSNLLEQRLIKHSLPVKHRSIF